VNANAEQESKQQGTVQHTHADLHGPASPEGMPGDRDLRGSDEKLPRVPAPSASSLLLSLRLERLSAGDYSLSFSKPRYAWNVPHPLLHCCVDYSEQLARRNTA
jgi:hypothetical protein